MKKYILLSAVLASPFFVAQISENEKEIDSVEIKGRTKVRKERNEFLRNSQSTELISSYELTRNNPSMIEHALGTVAGVQVDKRTQFGGQRIVVRGYGNDQKFNNWGVKMYLNNAPITNADGVTILEDIDFSLINQVEVVKGPAATLYGGGTGGAVKFYINPETRKGSSISQNTSLGSFSTFQTNTKLETVSDKFSLFFNYGHIESDGYRPRSKSRKNIYTFAGNVKLNENQNLSFLANHSNSFEQVTGQISYADYYAGNDPGNAAYARRNAANYFISNRFSLNHFWKLKKNFTNSTSVFFNHLDVDRTAAGAYEVTQNPNYGFRSVFNFDKELSENFSNNIEFGAEFLISKMQTSNYRFAGTGTNPMQTTGIAKASYFKYDNQQASFFAVNKLTFSPWNLTFLAGFSGNMLSYDRKDLLAIPGLVSNYNRDLSFTKNFPVVFTPHFAVTKKYKNQIFNLSYSEGYNTPTATTAFNTGTGQTNDDLLAEKAKMWDFSVHGILAKTKFDYQVSVFNIDVKNKLTQLSATNAATNTKYNYWANTGNQRNQGFEVSLGYLWNENLGFLKRIEPFVNYSYYNFEYTDFKTYYKPLVSNPATGDVEGIRDFSGKKVIGVPANKLSLGLDFETKIGFYWNNTFNYLDKVYTDFNNTNAVKGFGLLNSKLGYKKTYGNWDFDAYFAGNNLTNQINYTFLFLGNNVGDSDSDSNYPANVATDVTPGYHKAYFFWGLNMKYRF